MITEELPKPEVLDEAAKVEEQKQKFKRLVKDTTEGLEREAQAKRKADVRTKLVNMRINLCLAEVSEGADLEEAVRRMIEDLGTST